MTGFRWPRKDWREPLDLGPGVFNTANKEIPQTDTRPEQLIENKHR
jgi:hypothetical protein